MISEMNTHEVFKKLTKHGFTEEQAEGITEAIASVTPNNQSYVRKEIFEDSEKDRYESKADLAVMKSELRYVKDNMVTKADLKAALAELRAETTSAISELRTETKSDIAEAKSELKAEIAEAKSELRTEIAQLKTSINDSHSNLLRWMISLFITMIIGFFVPLILK